jgi:hypothetical protein
MAHKLTKHYQAKIGIIEYKQQHITKKESDGMDQVSKLNRFFCLELLASAL